ncbi:transglutaminase family protein [Thalassovita taeanensis]|uniref:Transglutaminase-like enzyme, putative cysteine protease n=1 Tax=Thalassovita taeanensis TaxID=657014 RepID=A0A1H9DRE7_9RHOB|nr:transglutaminase family protein [Thalassovita taeanensis]SEQ15258.1 Transglutaminase-like enzyme, putative cysteine protease [Thalassovita taeanensis]
MQYDIKLVLENTYPDATGVARNLIHVMPLHKPGQQALLSGSITVSPRPDERRDSCDFFGNTVTEIAFRSPLAALSVTLSARVERFAVPEPQDAQSCLLEHLGPELKATQTVAPHSPQHFLSASPRVATSPAMTAFAFETTRPGMRTLEAVRAVGQRLHKEMRFDAGATDVDTPPETAFANRHGVCQDFSHVMIACLRGRGIPAGYVSGFLRTSPPKGRPRLEGADAMHAWVRAWCGTGLGWVEYDPTNDLFVAEDHIVVAYGRDYSEVAPLRGVLRTSGAQSSSHRVDVKPLA